MTYVEKIPPSGKYFKANTPFTLEYENNRACSCACKVVCCYDDKYTKDVKINSEVSSNEDEVYDFIKTIVKRVKWSKRTIRDKLMLQTVKEVKGIDEASQCHAHMWRWTCRLKTTVTSLVALKEQDMNRVWWWIIEKLNTKNTLSIPHHSWLLFTFGYANHKNINTMKEATISQALHYLYGKVRGNNAI